MEIGKKIGIGGSVAFGLLLIGLVLGAVPTYVAVTEYYRTASLNVEVESGYCAHIQVWVTRADTGETILIKDGVAINNAGVLTNIGKDWIENQLGNSPSTTAAQYIALSTSSSTPSASWTQLPSEITTGGLARAQGTYQSTGTGQWTITYQWTATATHTDVQLTGLHWGSSGDNNLLCADTFTPVTLNSGDKLTVTWTITVS